MKLCRASLSDKAGWAAAHVTLPQYDVAAAAEKTKKAPTWIHFGTGNIFRAYIASLAQRMLNEGLTDKGLLMANTNDPAILDIAYAPFDNLCIAVTLNPDATTDREIIGSIAEGLKADSADEAAMARFREIFTDPGLQMLSFTITEKGYKLHNPDGTLLPAVEADMKEGPHNTKNAMASLAKFLYWRYRAGGYPLAVCSFDNCSHNGQTFHQSVSTIAKAWVENGLVESGFALWLDDPSKVSFPWSMIDKIVPRPSKVVEESLTADGIEGMEAIVTKKGGYTAAFVNAERPEYLVIEDQFPNGRPPLDKVGVIFCDRETVNKVERMKVTTCLNPLHTAMSVNGCLLGYTKIADEMKDADIVALVKRLGYVEGLPVVTNPGIVSPKAFLDEVVEKRLPNVFMPDDPRRIATDTSQKVGVRFGETIKSYLAEGRDLNALVSLPLALAGWLRYLLAVNDAGEAMEVSDDPLKETLQAQLRGIVWNDPASYHGQLRPILANASIFGVDLTATPLSDKIEKLFVEELSGPGAVRATLQKYLA
ncbi:mannitol dehydrogenase family protein [Oscillibacter sp.]|uniref:mannitol dehydrogenase family protein n=1 Tax=Oscillibacter sp. TaxID=1945593 RepID=UPI00262E0F34|nr:mannitol dehydrogenase family protein [Oscillibacter sp.]MDD3346567.1 mannitol dehydrogenase family protein [Oscillibacter sp.]